VARPTENEFPRPDATPADLRAALLRIAAELRTLRIGNQPERIERIVELLAAPKLAGILAQIGHPQSWVTPDGSRALAEHLMRAAAIILELMDDAKITGSDAALERAREWLVAMDLVETE
jgi:hypothetical protein